jgi:isoquinoline 1-oxidoreductase alpha subunit
MTATDHRDFTLTVNGRRVEVTHAAPGSSLLEVLREQAGLTGTKGACEEGECGSCSVLVDGELTCSCLVMAADAEGAKVTTVEGLAGPGTLHPVQEAWMEHQVAQCGYCQSGQMMQAAALLAGNPDPTDAQIDMAMSGNLCRCGTYPRIRSAVRSAAAKLREQGR